MGLTGTIADARLSANVALRDASQTFTGVNTFRGPETGEVAKTIELARSTDAEKRDQLDRLADFQTRHAAESTPAIDHSKMPMPE